MWLKLHKNWPLLESMYLEKSLINANSHLHKKYTNYTWRTCSWRCHSSTIEGSYSRTRKAPPCRACSPACTSSTQIGINHWKRRSTCRACSPACTSSTMSLGVFVGHVDSCRACSPACTSSTRVSGACCTDHALAEHVLQHVPHQQGKCSPSLPRLRHMA